MPRIARFAIASIAELSRQLRYAPPETRAKQMDAAEVFAAEVETDQLYPEDFIIYRITGYRPQMENPALLVGEALAGDLANFIQLLSDGLDLPPDYRGRAARSLDQVAQRLNVALKTVQRYRRRGLICHYIRFGEDDHRLACFDDALARFINGHQQQLERARDFSRVETTTAGTIIEEARSLRQGRRLSLNEAALILARKHHRAHETVRMILRKHDRRSPTPIFSERGPLTERDGRVLHRAARWGVPIALMAERYGRTATTIHRAINRHRAVLLRSIDLASIELPTFSRDDAADVILGHPAVRERLDQLLPRTDALALLEAAKGHKTDQATEVALIAAYNFLKRRAALDLAELGAWPNAAPLDRIETDLRWASLIKGRLVSLGIPAALARIEQHLERPLSQQPSERIVEAIPLAASVVAEVIDSLDPSRGHRLARVVAYSSDRQLARGRLPQRPGRAAVRHAAGAVAMIDPFASLSPWDVWLRPRQDLLGHLAQLDPPARALLEERYGCGIVPPHTLAEIADRHGLRPATITQRIALAETTLRRLARSAA